MPISIMQWRVEIGIFFGRSKVRYRDRVRPYENMYFLEAQDFVLFFFFYNANFTLVTLNQIQSLEDVILAIVSGYTIEI